MRQAKIIYKDEVAGILTQHDNGEFSFHYNDAWMTNSEKPSISLTLPKISRAFHSAYLFPFFYNLLPEGTNKQIICQHYRIDSDDYFGILMITAKHDSIGAVKVIENDQP